MEKVNNSLTILKNQNSIKEAAQRKYFQEVGYERFLEKGCRKQEIWHLKNRDLGWNLTLLLIYEEDRFSLCQQG